jgi:LCP family protein required for cell wall assembly
MFNSAFTVGQTRAGNPACTVNTVEHLTGLRVDHTVVVDFAGFAAMSRAVGGVPVCLPHPVYQGDLNPNLGYQGKLVFPAGRQVVEGARALQYVRVRHGLGDGSDIGRIRRQQAFLSSMIMAIRRQGLTATHILPLVDAATKNMTFDPGLGSPAKLLTFAMSLRQLDPAHIDFVTMPWRYAGARVAVVQPAANELWAALRHDRAIGRPARHAHHGAHRARPPRTGNASTQGTAHRPPADLSGGVRRATANLCSNLTYG